MGFPLIQTPDKNLQLVQNNIAAALNPLQAIPFNGGNMLTGVVLASGSNVIPHKLNHTPQYFIVSNINANANVWQTAVDSKNITLSASAACTVSLWVN